MTYKPEFCYVAYGSSDDRRYLTRYPRGSGVIVPYYWSRHYHGALFETPIAAETAMNIMRIATPTEAATAEIVHAD
jgi:hypothetical protein